MFRSLSVWFLTASLATSPLLAQRILSGVLPNQDSGKMKLTFDINARVDDDVAPNVVFTPDSSKGFVSYSSVIDETDEKNPKRLSGRIVVFRPESGQIIRAIDTGTIDGQPARPAQASITPDGKFVAVVNVLGDAIFIVDAQSAALKATYRFKDAHFGFGNNIVFSPDSRIGYISSFRQDEKLSPIEGEVIRFSVATGEEVGPRLRVGPGPAHLALSDDGRILTVVNTVTIKEGDKFFETISIIDTASFSVAATVKVEDADFTFVNNVALTQDGKRGIIGDRGRFGSKVTSRAIIFSTETGQVIATVNVGSAPGFVAITPDRKGFIILDNSNINLVSLEDNKLVRSQIAPRGSFTPQNSFVFSPDGHDIWVATSGLDLVLFSMDMRTGAVDELLELAQNPLSNITPPVHVAMTPNGKIIAVVDISRNSVSLIIDTFNLDFPFMRNDRDLFTTIALVNLSQSDADINLTALTDGGAKFAGEGIQNPKNLTLGPGKQAFITVDEAFGFGKEEFRSGWINLESDNFGLVGYFFAGNAPVGAVDGSIPVERKKSRTFTEMVFPVVMAGQEEFTQLSIVNPNFNLTKVKIEWLNMEGQPIADAVSLDIPGRVRSGRLLSEHFPEQGENTRGYLRVTSDFGIVGFELFGTGKSVAGLAGIPLSEPSGLVGAPSVGTPLTAPLFLAGQGFDSIVNIINLGDSETDILICPFDSSGLLVARPFLHALPPGHQLQRSISEIFELSGERPISGWLRVESAGARIAGNVIIVGPENSSLSAIPFATDGLKRIIFPHAFDDENFETRLTLLSTEEETAQVQVTAFNRDGEVVRAQQLTLPIRRQAVIPVGEALSEALHGGYIIVESSSRIFALETIHKRSTSDELPGQDFAVVVPQPLP